MEEICIRRGEVCRNTERSRTLYSPERVQSRIQPFSLDGERLRGEREMKEEETLGPLGLI